MVRLPHLLCLELRYERPAFLLRARPQSAEPPPAGDQRAAGAHQRAPVARAFRSVVRGQPADLPSRGAAAGRAPGRGRAVGRSWRRGAPPERTVLPTPPVTG